MPNKRTIQGTEVFEVISQYKHMLPIDSESEIAKKTHVLNSQGKCVKNVTIGEPRRKAAILWANTYIIMDRGN